MMLDNMARDELVQTAQRLKEELHKAHQFL